MPRETLLTPEGLAEHVALGLDLDAARPVDHVEEGLAAVAAPSREPAGDAVGDVRLLPVLEVAMSLANHVRGDYAGIGVRERLHAVRPQLLQLLPPIVIHRAATLRGEQAKQPRSW